MNKDHPSEMEGDGRSSGKCATGPSGTRVEETEERREEAWEKIWDQGVLGFLENTVPSQWAEHSRPWSELCHQEVWGGEMQAPTNTVDQGGLRLKEKDRSESCTPPC